MRWAILTYIILCPLSFLPGIEARDAQQLFYQLASVCIFAIGMFFPQREIKVNKINICLGVMLLAFVGAWIRVMNGWPIALNYLLGLMVYFTIIRTLTKDDLRFIIKGLIWILVLATIWLALQKVGFDLRGVVIRNSHNVGRNSFFFHASSMGLYYAQSLPLVLSSTWVGLLFLPVVKFSECSAAYLGIITSVLFFYWFRKRIIFWILLLPILVGGVYLTYNKEAFTGVKTRLPLWKVITQEIMKYPIGHGLDSFANPVLPGQKRFYMNMYTKELIIGYKQPDGNFKIKQKLSETPKQAHYYNTPHNEFLWLGYEIGLHGWVILAFLYYFIWNRFKACRKEALEVAFMASLIAISLGCIGQFGLHISRVGHMFPLILGGFVIATEEEENYG